MDNKKSDNKKEMQSEWDKMMDMEDGTPKQDMKEKLMRKASLIMFNGIEENIGKRIKPQIDSRCATNDEVRICWLISEIELMREKVNAAKNCLVCAAIGDPIEIIESTNKILEEIW